MSGITVVDQLIVKLGLDPRDFTKGEKQVAASVLKTEETVKKSSDGMGREISKLATKWLSVAAAVALVKKAVTIIDDVAERTRQLGIASKNFGLAANEMRNWENVVQLAGGSAEEARKSIGGLQKSIFDLAYNGQVSDSLTMLARLGVKFQDATGHARNFKDVALDTADAIAKAQQQGMTRGEAFQFLQQSGFDQGTANLLLSGRANAEKELAAQNQRHQVSGSDIDTATGIRRASIDKDQAIENGEIAAMQAVGGVQKTFNEVLAHPTEALNKLSEAATGAGTVLENWALKAAGLTRGVRNNNPGNLRAVGGQARDREGFAVFKTMEEGVAQANGQLNRYAKRGINTIDAIVKTWAPAKDGNDVKAYVDAVVKETGISKDTQLTEFDRGAVLASMFKHESGSKAPTLDDVADVLTANGTGQPILAGSQAQPTPNGGAGGGNTTKVDIDQITVHTRATDANAIAGDMDAAVQRKLMASHAEQGMQ